MVYFASFYQVNFEKAQNVPSWKVYLWTVEDEPGATFAYFVIFIFHHK